MHFKTSFFLFSSLLQPIFFMQPAGLRHDPISMPQMQRPLSCAIGRVCLLHALSAFFLHDACTSISQSILLQHARQQDSTMPYKKSCRQLALARIRHAPYNRPRTRHSLLCLHLMVFCFALADLRLYLAVRNQVPAAPLCHTAATILLS